MQHATDRKRSNVVSCRCLAIAEADVGGGDDVNNS